MSLDDVFVDRLNTEGHGFQFAVVQAMQRAGDPWHVAATEFPVAYKDRSTHIDILAWWNKRFGLLVGECKRVNPAYGNWVFARSPFTFHRYEHAGWLELLQPRPSTGGQASVLTRAIPDSPRRPYHIAAEVLVHGVAGDPQPKDVKGRSFASAITQVTEGVNGLITMLPAQKHILDQGPIVFLPVVFTTSKLLATDDAELNMADLRTGNIDKATFVEKPWLWFEHNVSPDLIHEVQRPAPRDMTRFNELLENRHTRCIAIVSANAIDTFLQQASGLLEYLITQR